MALKHVQDEILFVSTSYNLQKKKVIHLLTVKFELMERLAYYKDSVEFSNSQAL